MKKCIRCEIQRQMVCFEAQLRYQRPVREQYTDYCVYCYLDQLNRSNPESWQSTIVTIKSRVSQREDLLDVLDGWVPSEVKSAPLWGIEETDGDMSLCTAMTIESLGDRIVNQHDFVARMVAKREYGAPLWSETEVTSDSQNKYVKIDRFYFVWSEWRVSPYEIIVDAESRIVELMEIEEQR